MKSRTLTCITATILFVALAIPVWLAAQDNQDHKHKHHRYKLIDTGTLGGPSSSLGFEGERNINSRGALVSLVDTSALSAPPFCFSAGPPPDCHVGHTAEWKDGVLTDLGALELGGSGPLWISDSGLISGMSENGVIDPLTGFPEFRAVFWKDGNITDLGTLGGNESGAEGVNNRGQVAGCATNAMLDSFGLGCFGVPQQGRAFLWHNGVMQDLGTLGGPDSAAGLVNERGQVAGWALLDSTPNPVTGIPTQHPFLWENGTMKDLGTIGGTAVFLINDLNDQGHVVGGMNVAGDQSFHPFLWDGQSLRDLGTLGGDFGSANWVNEPGEVVGWACDEGCEAVFAFLWKDGVMTDLGVVEGDACSVAYSINSRRQVVGTSGVCGPTNHAFLWERGGPMIDLNTLVPSGSGVQLQVGLTINERGEIASEGVLPNGDQHAFLLIPCDRDHTDLEGCEDVPESTNAAAQSNPAPVTQFATNVSQGRLTPEMLAALRARVAGRNRGFGLWPRR